MTILSYDNTEWVVLNDRSSKFWQSQHPCDYVIVFWELGNKLILTKVTVSCSHVSAICDFPCWFPTSKINGESRRLQIASRSCLHLVLPLSHCSSWLSTHLPCPAAVTPPPPNPAALMQHFASPQWHSSFLYLAVATSSSAILKHA